MQSSDVNLAWTCAALFLSSLAGCSYQTYESAPLQPEISLQQLQKRNLSDERVLAAFQQLERSVPNNLWSRNDLIIAAQAISPELELARVTTQQRLASVKTAGQSPNPGLTVETEHHSETEGGISPWLFGALFEFVLERSEKRAARIADAQAAVEISRLTEQKVSWNIRHQVVMHYQSLINTHHYQQMLEQQIDILRNMLGLLERRQQLGEAGGFEVSTSRIELQSLRLRNSRQLAKIRQHRERLATAVGISAEELDSVLDESPGIIPVTGFAFNKSELQGLSLNKRYDIQQALLRYQKAEAKLILVIEKQYPDVVLTPGFIFDQGDNIWALAGRWVLPLFHNNEGPVAEAVSQRKVLAAEFLTIQNNVLKEVRQALSMVEATAEIRHVATDLLNELLQRQQLIERQQDLGYTDRLDVLRGQLEVLQAQLAQAEIDYQLHEAFNALEHVVQQSLAKNQ